LTPFKESKMTQPFINNQLRLFVNLKTIQANYQNLCAFTKTPIAAVLKANAYGLGAVPVGKALWDAGCRQFFFATIQEAIEVRAHLIDATIYVLHGCFQEEINDLLAHNLIPVLNNPDQLALWVETSKKQGQKLPCLLHFDTGMNRLGFSSFHAPLAKEALPFLDVRYIMSHLACADDLNNPYNAEQRERFLEIAKNFPGIPKSFAASEGMGLGPDYYFDLLRVGISSYGIIPYPPHTTFAVKPQAQIIQTRNLTPGETIGYGQRYTAPCHKRVGTIAMGFADGLPASATNNAHVYIGEYCAPIIGRVSMDLTVIDLTDIPESIAGVTTWVDVFNDNMSHLKLARESNIALYEITCRIGRRFQKIYTK
jgi:alanine racemase